MVQANDHLVFVGHAKQVEQYALVAAELKGQGRSSHFWACDSSDFKAAIKTNCFENVVHLAMGFQRGGKLDAEHRTRLERIRRWEENDGQNYWHQDCAFDRIVTGQTDPAIELADVRVRWTPWELSTLTCLVADTVEREVSGRRPAAVIGETNTLVYRTVFRTLNRRGILHLRPETPGHLDNRIYFENTLAVSGEWCLEALEKIGASNAPHEAIEWASAKVDAIRAGRSEPTYMKGVPRGAPRIWDRINWSTARRSVNAWRSAKGVEAKHSPRAVGPEHLSPLRKTERAVELEFRRCYYHRVISSEIPTGRMASYFLHVQPEFTVEGLAFEFQDQIAHIRNIVAGLPANVGLVVKEHRPMAGRRPREFYGELVSIPSVVLVDDRIKATDIVARSEVVFTLTGTVALEAMCLGVPAVIFGDVFYDALPGVYRARSKADIAKLLEGPRPILSATREEAVAAMAARFVASHPGQFALTECSPESAALMAAAIGAELGRRKS